MSDINQKREEFKMILRSLLITNANGIPLRRVNRDFNNEMGYNIQYRDFGFPNLEAFLRDFPDVAIFVSQGGETVLKVRPDEKTEHIHGMVQKQKPKARVNKRYHSNASKPPRLSIPLYKRTVQRTLNSGVHHTVKSNIQKVLIRYPTGLRIENFRYAYSQEFGFELDLQRTGFLRIEDLLISLESDGIVRLERCRNDIKVFPANIPVKPPRMLNQPNQTEVTQNKPESLPGDGWEADCPINKHVLENLKKVIALSPEGILITQLADKYKEVSGGKELNLRELGYNDCQDLANDLEHLFYIYTDENKEWVLRDAKLPRPKEPIPFSFKKAPEPFISDTVRNNFCRLLESNPDGIILGELDKLYELNFQQKLDWKAMGFDCLQSFLIQLNAPLRFIPGGLSEIKVTLSHRNSNLTSVPFNSKALSNVCPMPEDAVLPGESYTTQHIPEELTQDFFPVCVSTVISPGRIFLQLISESEYSNPSLDKLMDDLEEFYLSPAANVYKMPSTSVLQDQVCAVIFPEDGNWHRGCIVGKKGPTTVEVFYFDYGTTVSVDITLLRYLKKCFLRLPAQAISARMSNIRPAGYSWTQEGTHFLLKMCMDKPMMAQITSRTFLNTVSVMLCDTSGEDDIHLNKLLVEYGHALPNNDSTELRRPYSSEFLESSANIESPYTYYNQPSYFASKVSPPPGISFPVAQATSLLSVPTNRLLQTTTSGLDVADIPCGMDVATVQRILSRSKSNVSNYPETPIIQAYEPPSTSIPNELPRAFDMEIVKRMLAKSVDKKENLPQAAVGPMQHSRNDPSSVVEPEQLDDESSIIIHSQPLQHNTTAFVPDSTNSGRELVRDTGVLNMSHGATVSEASTQWPNSNQRRFCKRVELRDNVYKAYLINYLDQPCFTSCTVSSFVFGPDIVKRILHLRKYPNCHVIAEREKFPILFFELERYQATGFTTSDTQADKVVLYKLSDVIRILSFFKHKSVTLAEDIEDINSTFNPQDPYWMNDDEEFSDEDTQENRDMLQVKMDALVKQKKDIMAEVMKKSETGTEISTDHANIYLKIEIEIEEISKRLSNVSCNPATRSAAEEAEEFLDRIAQTNDNSPDEACAEDNSYVETISCNPTTSHVTFAQTTYTDASIPVSSLSHTNQNSIAINGQAVMNHHHHVPNIPYNLPLRQNFRMNPVINNLPLLSFLSVPPPHMYPAQGFSFNNMPPTPHFNPNRFLPNPFQGPHHGPFGHPH